VGNQRMVRYVKSHRLNVMEFEPLMLQAIAEASQSGSDVPVGAVLVGPSGEILARAHNRKEELSDPTSHAEIEVIRGATSMLGDWRLENCTLVVTLEPCVMCAGAIVAARIPRVVFGAWDERVGAAGSIYDILRDSRLGRPVEVFPSVLEDQCQALLRNFFEEKRP
jgi:tRNA(adenine34) deaminase